MANDFFIKLISQWDGKGVKGAKKDIDSLKKFAKEVGGALGVGLGAREVLDFTKESINLARIQAQAEAQVAAAIESTGNAAGTSLQELKAHAAALQGVTNFGDEATLQGQALLLTFKNLSANLPRATAVMLDTSQAMGQDIKSSAIQLGKALNDPIAGLSALSKVGITFSESQQDLIKSLAESGKLFEAQSLILDELESQFGGSAKAARDADGDIAALGNSYGDLQEAVGGLFLALTEATGAGEKSIFFIDAITERINIWPGIFDNAGTTVDLLADKFDNFTDRLALTQPGIAKFLDSVAAGLSAGLGIGGGGIDPIVIPPPVVDADDTVDTQEEINNEFLDLQRGFSKDLIELQADTDAAFKDALKDLNDDLQDAAEDNQDRLADIAKSGAKQRLSIDKDLAKALSKADVDLGKSLGKLKENESKQLQKLQSSAAKEDANQRKRAAVDALGDERLFQFELRKLSAEGDGIAILEAKERRAIEQEIAKEKAETEASIEDGRRRDQEQEIRSETADRTAQLREESIERKAELEARRVEELQELAESEAEQIANAQEAFVKRQEDLQEHYGEKVKSIEEGERESIAKLAEGLTEMEDLTAAEFDQLVMLAKEFGPKIGEALATELGEAFASNLKIDRIIAGIGGGGASSGVSGGGGSLPPMPTGIAPAGGFLPFAEGGIVPGPTGAPRMAIVHGGEEVLTPQQRGGVNLTVSVNAPVFGVDDLERKIEAGVQELVNQLKEHFN